MPASAAGSSSEEREVEDTGRCDLQSRVHIDTDHVPARREPQLALAGEQQALACRPPGP